MFDVVYDFDVAYDTFGRDGFTIDACHRCLLCIQMRSYILNIFCPSAFCGTFIKSVTKATKRTITRDYVDRNIPDAFDVVYDTYGRDGCSITAAIAAGSISALVSSLFLSLIHI